MPLLLAFLRSKTAWYALFSLILGLAVYAGIHSVRAAYSEREQLRVDVAAEKLQHVADVQAAKAEALAAAAREKAAADAAAAAEAARQKLADRNAQTQKDLDYARKSLSAWARSAPPDVRRCLDVVVPDGLPQRAGVPAADRPH